MTLVSINRWMDKEEVVCMYNGILYSSEIEQNIAIYDSMGEFRGHSAKWNKSGRGRQIPYSFTDTCNQKTKINKTKTDS